MSLLYLRKTILREKIRDRKKERSERTNFLIQFRKGSSAFGMYSEHFIPGIRLTKNTTETIYEQEVMNISKPRSYMGIWQLFGLSSVLQMPIYSVHPSLGAPEVRRDLHRLTELRQKTSDDLAVVMWTTTRTDMENSWWVPNHFVPVLHIDRNGPVEDGGTDGEINMETEEINF